MKKLNFVLSFQLDLNLDIIGLFQSMTLTLNSIMLGHSWLNLTLKMSDGFFLY